MDYDIVPPPPPADKRNPAGGLLNRFDSANMQVKILCVGMFNTGKSTFLNRWQTNLKVKTRTTINVDFYERHVDGFFPIMLQDKPEPSLVDPDAVGLASTSSISMGSKWACVDFPLSSTTGGRSGPQPLVSPSSAASPLGAGGGNFLSTAQPFGGGPSSHNASRSDLDAAGDAEKEGNSRQASMGSPTAALSRSPQRAGSGLLSSSLMAAAAGGSGSGGDFWSSSAASPSLVADGIALKSYRNPRYLESSPNVLKALTRASEVAKKARSSLTGEPSTDRFDALVRSTQRRPIVEVDGVQVMSIYTLTRDVGPHSGSGRSTTELYGVSQLLPDIRRTVRDPRQVLASAMNTNFGYAYYEKRPLHVQCWDIQGQEHSRNMSRTYYADAMAALVFVDIGRPESLADAVLWRDDIMRKVFVKTATDASIEAAAGGGGGGLGGAARDGTGPTGGGTTGGNRHGRGMRTANTGSAIAAGRGGATTPNNAASGPSPFASSGAAYDTEEEAQIPCWLVLNKCDLIDPKTYQFPSKESWQSQTGGLYKDLDDFCAKAGFVGWSLASATQNINVNGIMDRVIQHCCNQFPREMYRFSTRGKQNMLHLPKPRPRQQKKCCGQNK